MAEPLFTASMDATEVLALFERMGPSVDFVCREVGLDTAKRIVAEAQSRVARATGETAAEIHWELTRDGLGYVVLAYDRRLNTTFVETYLQYGTMFMRARPFFFSSAMLEDGPHRRRLTERMQEWLDAVGR